jgi:hypothetical protein
MKLFPSRRILFTTVLFILGISTLSFSQAPGHIYFSQWSAGAGFLTNEEGRGFPVTGNINDDDLADFVMPVLDMFHVGIASINDGQLTFSMQQTEYYNTEELLHRSTLLDMNNDGRDDCFMLRDDAGPCCPPLVFFNENLELSNDPLVFPQPALLPAVNVPAHLNSDTILDTIYAVNGLIEVIDGLTGTTHPITSNAFLTIESLHDFNADGLMDIMFDVIQSATLDTAATVVLLNQGDFQFEKFETTERMFADQYGDFDNDGISDIVSTNGPGDFQIRTHLLTNDQAETIAYDFPQFSSGISYFIHDLDGDNFSDILVFENDSSYFCHNMQDQTFEVYAYPFLSRNGLFFAWDSSWGLGNLVVQDGTGRPFLFKATFENGNYQIENRTNLLNPPVLPQPAFEYASCMIDIDADQHPELLFSNGESLVFREWENGSFQFNEYISNLGLTPTYDHIDVLSSGDFNGDNLMDLVYETTGLPTKLQVKFAQTDSTFSEPLTIDENNLLRRILTADINGDLIDDLVVAWGSSVVLYKGQGNNQFLQNQLLAEFVQNFVFIDPDEDGFPDLAITIGDSTKIYMNNAGDFELTQELAGRLPKNNLVGSNQLMLFFPDQISAIRLIQLDQSGENYAVVWVQTVPDFINYRKAYQFDYDRDGWLDLCYNKPQGNGEVANLVSGMVETQLNNRSIQGVTDLNLDGVEDIIWQIGPQIHVEVLDSAIMTTTYEPTDSDINVFPNPTSGAIQFESVDGNPLESIRIYHPNGSLISTHTGNAIDISHLPGGLYILRITALNRNTVVKKILKM